jgi:hypothetical protein
MWTKALAFAVLAAAVVVALAGRTTPVRRALVPAPSKAEEALARVLPEVWLEGVPFDQAMAKLKELSGVEIEIVIDWPDLREAGLPTNFPVTLRQRNQTLGEVLRLVLRQSYGYGGGVGYAPEGDAILVATEFTLVKRTREVRCYDVRNLVAADGSAQSGRKMPPPDLARLIGQTVDLSTGTADVFAGRLVVVHSWESHRRTEEVLRQLRTLPSPTPAPPAAPDLMVWHEGLKQWVPHGTGPVEALLARKIPRVDIDTASLQDALRSLHELSGANLLLSGVAARVVSPGASAIRLDLRDVTLGEALDALLKSVPSEAPLAYTLEDGLILVTTRADADTLVFSRAYDVRDWLAASGGNRAQAGDRLAATLKHAVVTDTWRDNNPAVEWVKVLDGFLVVIQTERNHESIRRTLDSLRAGISRPAAPSATRPATTGPTVRPGHTAEGDSP